MSDWRSVKSCYYAVVCVINQNPRSIYQINIVEQKLDFVWNVKSNYEIVNIQVK